MGEHGHRALWTALALVGGLVNGQDFLCPYNAESCGWEYIEVGAEAFCYKIYNNLNSAKDVAQAEAQCTAQSQAFCPVRIYDDPTADSFGVRTILQESSVSLTLNDRFWFFSEIDNNYATATVNTANDFIVNPAANPAEKLRFICRSCAFSQTTPGAGPGPGPGAPTTILPFVSQDPIVEPGDGVSYPPAPENTFFEFLVTNGGVGNVPQFYSAWGEACDIERPLSDGATMHLYNAGWGASLFDTIFVQSGGGTSDGVPSGTEVADTFFWDVSDPLAGWQQSGDLNTAREGHCHISETGSSLVYALGGYSNSLPLNSIEVFDPSTGMWSTSATTLPNNGGTMECVRSCSDPDIYYAIMDDGSGVSSVMEVSISSGVPTFTTIDTVNGILEPNSFHVFFDPITGAERYGTFINTFIGPQHITEITSAPGTPDTRTVESIGGLLQINPTSLQVVSNCDRPAEPAFLWVGYDNGNGVYRHDLNKVNPNQRIVFEGTAVNYPTVPSTLGAETWMVTADSGLYDVVQFLCGWNDMGVTPVGPP